MPSDDQGKRKLDLGEDLDLSSLDDDQERQRQKQLASIPGRIEKSPLVRKVIAGRRAPAPDAPHGGSEEEGRSVESPEEGDLPEMEPRPEAGPEAKSPRGGGVEVVEVAAELAGEREKLRAAGMAALSGAARAPAREASRQRQEVPARRRRRRGVDAEAEWTGSRGTLWWLLAGMGAVIVISLFLFREFQQSGTKEALGTPSRPPESASIEGTPMEVYVRKSTELLPVVRDLITKLNAREEGQGAELFRDGKNTLARMKAWHERVPKLADFDIEAYHDLHAAVTMETGYLTLDGWRKDYTRGKVYLLEQDGQYLVDWEATVGYSELLPEEVAELSDDGSYLMRCVMGRSLYYTPQYPEEEYVCYALHHFDPAEFTWAYAKRGTKEATAIEAHLSFNLRPPVNGRAAVRVRKAQTGARPNQVEIVGFLHAGWVAPERGQGDADG